MYHTLITKKYKLGRGTVVFNRHRISYIGKLWWIWWWYGRRSAHNEQKEIKWH